MHNVFKIFSRGIQILNADDRGDLNFFMHSKKYTENERE